MKSDVPPLSNRKRIAWTPKMTKENVESNEKQCKNKRITNTSVYEVSLIPPSRIKFTFINIFNNTLMINLTFLRMRISSQDSDSINGFYP